MPIAPQANGLDGGTDGSRFATVLVNNNLWFFPPGAEAHAQEVHLCLDDRKIVLCAALQNETCTQSSKVRHLGDIQKNILGQYRRQPGQYLFSPPTLALKLTMSDSRNTAQP